LELNKRGVNAAFFYAWKKRNRINLMAQVFLEWTSSFFTLWVFNLSLTHHLQTLDRISRYFKAKFSALIR